MCQSLFVSAAILYSKQGKRLAIVNYEVVTFVIFANFELCKSSRVCGILTAKTSDLFI